MTTLECLRAPECSCPSISKECRFVMDFGLVPPRQEYNGESPAEVIGNVLRELVDALPESVKDSPDVRPHILQSESVLLILKMTGGKA